MQRTVRLGSQQWVVATWSNPTGGTPVDLRDRVSAQELFALLLRDPANAVVLRQAMHEVVPGSAVAGWASGGGRGSGGGWGAGVAGDAALAGQLASQAAAGRILLFTSVRPVTFDLGNVEVQPQQTQSPPPPKKAKPKTWVKFKVVDDASGEPVPNVRLRITTPDGIENFYTTNPSGMIQIEDIEHGTCDVTCDLKDARLSDTLHYVGDGEPPKPSGASHGNGVRQIRRIAIIRRHKVEDGDTLEALAAEAGMKWQDLAKFNWGSDDARTIAQKLRDEVGCTAMTRDGKGYEFRSTDKPGIIFIPEKWEKSGLAVETTHVFRVQAVRRFFVTLENELGLRIPEAAYEATLADGSVRSGTLGIGGVDAIDDPPEGPVAVVFTDLDDVNAKSLAAAARHAFDQREASDLFRLLKHGRTTIDAAIAAYEKYYNTLSGKGLIEDIYEEITDPDALTGLVGLMALAGLPTRENAQYFGPEGSA